MPQPLTVGVKVLGYLLSLCVVPLTDNHFHKLDVLSLSVVPVTITTSTSLTELYRDCNTSIRAHDKAQHCLDIFLLNIQKAEAP